MQQLLIFHYNNFSRTRLSITLHIHCLSCCCNAFTSCKCYDFRFNNRSFNPL